MPKLDSALAARIIPALQGISADATPLWGKMNRPQMYGHVRATLRYPMGQGPDMPFKGNWKSRWIFRHMILGGIVEIPKGIKLPAPKGAAEPPAPPEATFDELRETIEEFVAKGEAGELQHRMHPFFGMLNNSDWQRFHVAHTKHHMKQFGVWPD